MVELFLERADVDQARELHRRRAVEDAERNPDLAMAPVDGLRHQQLVKIGVEHRAYDRVDLPFVIVDAGGDVGHGSDSQRLGAEEAALPWRMVGVASSLQKPSPRQARSPGARAGVSLSAARSNALEVHAAHAAHA